MGFWGTLGKGLLKAAPIAAGFIPGVGPLASMAIGAGAGALSKKVEGGDWKSSLGGALSGGMQGAMSSGLKGGLSKGLGPSKGADFMGPQQSLGSKMSNMPWGNIAKGAAIGGGALAAGKMLSNRGGENYGGGLGPSSYPGYQNRTPNLENYIQQGRQEAMMNQPWRQARGIFPQMGQSPRLGNFGDPYMQGYQGGLGPSRNMFSGPQGRQSYAMY